MITTDRPKPDQDYYVCSDSVCVCRIEQADLIDHLVRCKSLAETLAGQQEY